MHYARQCDSYNKWYDHNSVATIRKPHCLTGSHTQFHAEDFLSYIYVSSRCNRPRRFGGTNNKNSKSTVGAQLKFQRWANNSTSTVEILVLGQFWANVSTPTMTCCQQFQPLPNVGPTIACYLGMLMCHIFVLSCRIDLTTCQVSCFPRLQKKKINSKMCPCSI